MVHAPLTCGNLICLGIILQFDGSLRYPIDPCFPAATSRLGRLAACAACIILEPTDGLVKIEAMKLDCGKELFMLGGKAIPADSSTTSGEVEYEGLFFGLEKLNIFLSDYERVDPSGDKKINLVIQGDCKNIIEQMNGLARPRKLEKYHELCKAIVEKLPEYNFVFQHIPRKENLISDRLANYIILVQQMDAFNKLNYDLATLESREQELREQVTNTKNRLPIVVDAFMTDIDRIERSFIPFSLRPAVYRRVVSLCQSVGDHLSIFKIGELLQSEINSVWKSVGSAPTIGYNSNRQRSLACNDNFELYSGASPDLHQLMVEAVTYQVHGLRLLHREKEAQLRYRKSRHLFRQSTDANLDFLKLGDTHSAQKCLICPQLLLPDKRQSQSSNWPDRLTGWIEMKLKTDSHRKSSVEFWYCTENSEVRG